MLLTKLCRLPHFLHGPRTPRRIMWVAHNHHPGAFIHCSFHLRKIHLIMFSVQLKRTFQHSSAIFQYCILQRTIGRRMYHYTVSLFGTGLYADAGCNINSRTKHNPLNRNIHIILLFIPTPDTGKKLVAQICISQHPHVQDIVQTVSDDFRSPEIHIRNTQMYHIIRAVFFIHRIPSATICVSTIYSDIKIILYCHMPPPFLP